MQSKQLVLALLASTFSLGALASTVTITNNSAWAFHNLYVSSTSSEEWGPDQLGQHVVGSGESYHLNNVPCDSYDVKLVDEDGDECVVRNVKLCDDDHWNVTNDDLLACQVLTEE